MQPLDKRLEQPGKSRSQERTLLLCLNRQTIATLVVHPNGDVAWKLNQGKSERYPVMSKAAGKFSVEGRIDTCGPAEGGFSNVFPSAGTVTIVSADTDTQLDHAPESLSCMGFRKVYWPCR